jgi:hypothetical protein
MVPIALFLIRRDEKALQRRASRGIRYQRELIGDLLANGFELHADPQLTTRCSPVFPIFDPRTSRIGTVHR